MCTLLIAVATAILALGCVLWRMRFYQHCEKTDLQWRGDTEEKDKQING